MCIRDRLDASDFDAQYIRHDDARVTEGAALAGMTSVSYTHLDVYKRQEWGVVRFLITFVITYFLMSLMILVGIWFPARQVIRIHPCLLYTSRCV